jgi:hypothetical protein
VGGPKCGTTYLQTVLWGNQQRLRDAGVLLPGERMFQHNLAATRARVAQPRKRVQRVWDRLLTQMQEHDGTAVLSNEWFTLADAEGAGRTLAELGEAEVHVVFTARDLTSLVPAAWQEQLKLGHGQSLDDFLEGLERPRERWTWWTLDPAEVLERWVVPPERVHVVTLPAQRGDQAELWHRFASVLGVPEGLCDLDLARPNESVGVVSARLLELLGPRLREAVDADGAAWTEQYRWLRRYVSHTLLVPRKEPRIALRPEQWDRVRGRAEQSASRLRDAGYQVHGELEELVSAVPDPAALVPDQVSTDDLLAASNDLAVGLLSQLRATADEGAKIPGGL